MTMRMPRAGAGLVVDAFFKRRQRRLRTYFAAGGTRKPRAPRSAKSAVLYAFMAGRYRASLHARSTVSGSSRELARPALGPIGQRDDLAQVTVGVGEQTVLAPACGEQRQVVCVEPGLLA